MVSCLQNLETQLEDLLREDKKPSLPPPKPRPAASGAKVSSNVINTEDYHIMGPNCYTMSPVGYKYKGKDMTSPLSYHDRNKKTIHIEENPESNLYIYYFIIPPFLPVVL
jgi:hypothetical protein